MDTSARHRFWEINVSGHSRPVLAADVLSVIGDKIESHGSPILRAKIAKSLAENPNKPYLECCECGNSLFYRNGGIHSTAHFYHSSNHVKDLERLQRCQFYTATNSKLLSEIYNGEGAWHFKTKHKLAKLLEESPYIKNNSVLVEKYIFDDSHEINVRRKPDIQFEDDLGQLWALELTRWWMNPLTIELRQVFYKNKGINLLWLFSPDCKLQNKSTWDQIMFGSNIEIERGCNNVDAQCNAFSITDETLLVSEKTKLLSFVVEYPIYYFSENEKLIKTNFGSEPTDLKQLVTDPTKRLPYAVNTTKSLITAKEHARKYNRSTFAGLLRSLRFEYSKMVFSVNKMFWFEHFNADMLRHFDALVPTGFELGSRAMIIRSKLYEQYSKSLELSKRNSKAEMLNNLRRYFHLSKNIRASALFELQEFLKLGIPQPLIGNYRFADSAKWMYKKIEVRVEEQIERNRTANRIRYRKNKLRTYKDLAQSRPEDLSLVYKYTHQLIRDIGPDSKRLTCLVKAYLAKLTVQQEKYQAMNTAQFEREKAIYDNKIARIQRELTQLKAELNDKKIIELPVSNSAIETRFNRLIKDCMKMNLDHEVNDLKSMRKQYKHSVYEQMMFNRYPKIFSVYSKGFCLDVDYDDEIHRLIQASDDQSIKDKSELFIQKGERRLLELYEFNVSCELHWVQNMDQLPSNEVLIEMKKNGASRARRLIKALQPLINSGHTKCIDLELAQWLLSKYKFIRKNPNAVRY